MLNSNFPSRAASRPFSKAYASLTDNWINRSYKKLGTLVYCAATHVTRHLSNVSSIVRAFCMFSINRGSAWAAEIAKWTIKGWMQTVQKQTGWIPSSALFLCLLKYFDHSFRQLFLFKNQYPLKREIKSRKFIRCDFSLRVL